MRCVVLIACLLASSCSLERELARAELGTVYRCGASEWCWARSVDELENDVGAACVRTSRLVVPVCIWECPPPDHGCDALSGCYCPGAV